MKKKLSFVFALSLCFVLVGCSYTQRDVIYSGDFVYCIYEDNCISIVGLTEKGKREETLIFPDIIDGYMVKYYGMSLNGFRFDSRKSGHIIIENAKKVYFTYTSMGDSIGKYESSKILYNPTKNVDSLDIYISGKIGKPTYYFIYDDAIDILDEKDAIDVKIHVSKYAYDTEANEEKLDEKVIERLEIANVEYYKIPTDDYPFFVDDVDGGIIEINAPTPYLEGYEFVDWYKDEELTQKWDFENDIVPAKNYDSDGNYIYEPTKLYAKWKENN